MKHTKIHGGVLAALAMAGCTTSYAVPNPDHENGKHIAAVEFLGMPW